MIENSINNDQNNHRDTQLPVYKIFTHGLSPLYCQWLMFKPASKNMMHGNWDSTGIKGWCQCGNALRGRLLYDHTCFVAVMNDAVRVICAGMTAFYCSHAPAWECCQGHSASRTARAVQDSSLRRSAGTMPYLKTTPCLVARSGWCLVGHRHCCRSCPVRGCCLWVLPKCR
jgi:hypothetical protein